MFDVIERLKSDWTDKYVVIDSAAPELARFANATGIVRTVNMNGRCLVEFDQFNNIAWYDIDPSALKIVSEPRPKPVEKEAAKPAATAKAPAAKPAKPATAAKPAAGRPSTADILAAARGKAAPAADKPKAAAGGRPSTAEILAQARAARTAAATEPPPAKADDVASAAEADDAAADIASAAEAPPARPAAAKPAAGGPLPTTTADKIAWCRARDGK
jgi:hypothetical protein